MSRDEIKPFIDFYGKNRIAPVSQDISDLNKHFERRAALLRHLGIPPGLVKGIRIIEFGPGTGHNALYTLSLRPAEMLLVDGNPTSLKSCRDNLGNCQLGDCRLSFDQCLIEDFAHAGVFDLVWCEGTIPLQRDPGAMLCHIAQFAAPQGIVVFTTVDAVSHFAETLMRLSAHLYCPDPAEPGEFVARVKPMLGPQLETLGGMSRSHEDWILDNVVQPFVGRHFSIVDAIEAVGDRFEVHGASPHFLADWRWYKEIFSPRKLYNELAARSYYDNLHNLLDYRLVSPPRDAEANWAIAEACARAFELTMLFEQTHDPTQVREVLSLTAEMAEAAREFSPETSAALGDYVKTVEQYLDRSGELVFGEFAPLFGRGNST